VFLKLFGMNEATLMRGPPDGGERSARADNALHGAGADVGDPALCSDHPSDSCGAILLAVGGDVGLPPPGRHDHPRTLALMAIRESWIRESWIRF
jgi:hypothetical protein